MTRQHSLLQTVVEVCQKKRQCKFNTSPKTFQGDPCPGLRKYIEVAYKCRPCKYSLISLCTHIRMNTRASEREIELPHRDAESAFLRDISNSFPRGCRRVLVRCTAHTLESTVSIEIPVATDWRGTRAKLKTWRTRPIVMVAERVFIAGKKKTEKKRALPRIYSDWDWVKSKWNRSFEIVRFRVQ